MRRINKLAQLIPLYGLLFLFSCAEKPANSLPNILIIYADDMGYGDLACQNPEAKLTTPNLDQLAAAGIRFTDGHSSSGICTPSRFALLTGQYHWRRMHGIVGPFGGSVFKEEEFTLARMLKEKGYATACIGKWHLGWDWDSLKVEDAQLLTVPGDSTRRGYGPQDFDWQQACTGGPLDQGFDYYFGDGTINFPPYAFIENDRLTETPTEYLDLAERNTKEGNWEFRPGPMVKDWDPYRVLPTLEQKAVTYIKQQKQNQPFFLYFALPSPHAPIIPNEEFVGKTEAGGYGDFVFQTDYVAGQVLEALEEQGLAQNTLVIFTSDNGPEHYAYPRTRNYGHYSTGPLRGLKRDIYEGGHRVPFVMRWPEKIEAGRVSNDLIHQVDIAATIAAIVDFPMTAEYAVDSYNFLPLLLGEELSKPIREVAVHNTFKDGFVIRQGDWVLIERFSGYHSRVPDWYFEENGYQKDDPEAPGLLFNVKTDLGQFQNQYEVEPDKVKELKALLETYRESERTVPHPQ
ncbi:MAG: arylsulfatase [Cyanothece sp. SIO1E1]|nr:arylsulfatase [Cyanothece sp. SIO1E1]